MLFKSTPVADFVMAKFYRNILRDSNTLDFDRESDVFSRHPLTTEEIRETCRDLKVAGRRELGQLVNWRVKMKKFLEDVGSEGEEEEGGGAKEEEEGEGMEGIDDKVKALASKESLDVKRCVCGYLKCVAF